MTDRRAALEGLLAKAGWADATRALLAGDASNRRYDRLTDNAGLTAVLMDAPPEKGEDTRPFLAIARHLSRLGLAAPAIIAADEAAGYLLIEDLGDDLFARVTEKTPALEPRLYAAAVDVLAELHRHPPPDGIAAYGPDRLAPLAGLAFEWYLPGSEGHEGPVSPAPEFLALMLELCEEHISETPVLTLRDYHAENLLWLPERQGLQRVGLLDFQDAMAGHPAYDLMSLLKDARRDVPPQLCEEMLTRYIADTGQDDAPFRATAALLSAQRNLRILGVFARLCLRDGKPSYLRLIPRVWQHLMTDLSHPALAGLARMVKDRLPEPTESALKAIQNRCKTAHTPR